MISIPETTKPGRLEENWASKDIELTDEELQHMHAIVDSTKPQGDRYNEIAAKKYWKLVHAGVPGVEQIQRVDADGMLLAPGHRAEHLTPITVLRT